VAPGRDDSAFNRRLKSNMGAGSSRLWPRFKVLATGFGDYLAGQGPSHGIKLN
jgi:hypothetical protein